MASYFPSIGTWYRDTETGQRFEIVAIDEKQKTIEVQYYDGDISEFDIESWGALKVVETDTPEDVYAGYDGIAAADDIGDVPINYGNPLEFIEPDNFTGYDELF